MNIFSAIFLGIIQGFTEFLPISSSAHLIIAQHFIPNFSQPGVLFDIILHAGTLAAVIFYFRKELLNIKKQTVILLILATIPAALIGILFSDYLEGTFSSLQMLGWQLILTAFLNFFVDYAKTSRTHIKIPDSLAIGIAQAVAIVPGISRSSATIFEATRRGINRQEAAEFSFLISIPAIGGAVAQQVLKYGFTSDINIPAYAGGFVASLIFGLLSIKVLLRALKSKSFSIFGVYCLILGIALIVYNL
jgi:undecaprenyl-diphosphatase